MRFFRSFFKITFLVALLGASLDAWAYDFEVDGIYYDLNDDGGTVSVSAPRYNWLYKNIVSIPSTVNYGGETLTVTADGDLNGDGHITIGDLSAMIDCLLQDDVTSQQAVAADVNHNHCLNIDDITTLISWLLTEPVGYHGSPK